MCVFAWLWVCLTQRGCLRESDSELCLCVCVFLMPPPLQLARCQQHASPGWYHFWSPSGDTRNMACLSTCWIQWDGCLSSPREQASYFTLSAPTNYLCNVNNANLHSLGLSGIAASQATGLAHTHTHAVSAQNFTAVEGLGRTLRANTVHTRTRVTHTHTHTHSLSLTLL